MVGLVLLGACVDVAALDRDRKIGADRPGRGDVVVGGGREAVDVELELALFLGPEAADPDPVRDSLLRLEPDRAEGEGVDRVGRRDFGQGADGRSRVDAEVRADAPVAGPDPGIGRRLRRPRVPDAVVRGEVGFVVAPVVGLTGLDRGGDIRAGERHRQAGPDGLSRGEVVVGRGRLRQELQREVPFAFEEAVEGDPVGGSADRRKADLAAVRAAPDFDQGRDRVAGVDPEPEVPGAVDDLVVADVDADRARRRGGPAEPHRVAVAGVQLARLDRRADRGPRLRDRQCRPDDLGGGEVVVRRRGERGRRREQPRREGDEGEDQRDEEALHGDDRGYGSAGDRVRRGLLDTARSEPLGEGGDLLGVEVGMDLDRPAPAQPDPVRPLVLVRGAVGAPPSVGPLHRDRRVPGPAADGDLLDLEPEVRYQPVEAFEPGFQRRPRVPLPAERVVAREDVVDIVGDVLHRRLPVALAERGEQASRLALDDRPIDHPPTSLVIGAVPPIRAPSR